MEPISLGFLVVNRKHENGYTTELAKRGQQFNIECVRFEPTSIDPSTLMISGEKFDYSIQKWVSDTFPIPSFIYDRCFYNRKESIKKSKPIVNWLKKNPQVTFLGFGLPDKWRIFSLLQSDPIISSYLPDTELVYHAEQILRRLKIDSSCLLKPVTGSRGNGIIAINQTSETITLTYHKGSDKKTKIFYSTKELSGWCEKLLHQQTYIMQPLLSLYDSHGYPFDIRLFLQKNQYGKWELVGKGVRKGYYGSFLSNLNAGGEPLTYEEWSSSLTPKQKVLLEDELNTIINQLPLLLENKCHRLFEIGIDIGYSKDGSVWILDMNSKPGRKTLIETNPQLAEKLYLAPFHYCLHLLKQDSQKGVEINE
ncbi:YheC/YheD family protein [Metabacillus sediminilitoris]|uniref:YheC/YheD family protein n=1 Tax=Metabacillus sediminilitoris TaxID=2567941 RepID=A0A4S4BZS1_9BACI|nr:YheC/YheD family protein [Metabacillus sediminilitoris]QGQ44506.1 YheC/YheD family protein [Metabacillus sediminilitoris]THF80130.1 YheC/YheD family protein [Metabacillus sediminilitoris]